MRDKAVIFILTTAIGFAAGFYAGRLYERNCLVCKAPAAVLDEVRDAPLKAAISDPAREEALRRIEAEMKVFKEKVDAIRDDFLDKIGGILATPEQHEKFKAMRERYLAKRNQPPAPPHPAAATNAAGKPVKPPQQEEFESVIMMVIMVPRSQEWFTRKLDLDAKQSGQARALLVEQRDRFIALVDVMPPPSTKLHRVAPPPQQPETAK
ncbi:MAG: hypothetical protein LBM92_05885 [Opitutaceae bacterium]|jgi:hypothetical protein|nr:hypothetical protein [Opitutaceae bacterium]